MVSWVNKEFCDIFMAVIENLPSASFAQLIEMFAIRNTMPSYTINSQFNEDIHGGIVANYGDSIRYLVANHSNRQCAQLQQLLY